MIYGGDSICLLPRGGALAVENIIGGIVNQPCIRGCGLFSHDLGCQTVHSVCQFSFGLGLVHGSVGRRIDDDIRFDLADCGAQGIEIGNISRQTIIRTAVQCDQLTQRCKGALQLPAHLTIFSQQKDFHALLERSV
ncbi:hypothetical protein D3C87_1442030 [compost metagenome]